MAENSKPRESSWEQLKNRMRSRRAESCSVYGSSAAAEVFLKKLGKDGIRSRATAGYHTKYHAILMEDDPHALAFYRDNLHGKGYQKVILALEGNMDSKDLGDNVQVISVAEVTAAMFWREHPPKPTEKMAFLGSDVLVTALIQQGLCLNLYSTAQCMRYHLWGGVGERIAGLGQVGMDKVILHKQPWQEELPCLQGMDRIVLCYDDAENEKALGILRSVTNCPTIYIRQGRDAGITADNHLPMLISFGDREAVLSREIVLRESLLSDARALNDYYRGQYGGEPWETLEHTKKLSSFSSASYFAVLRRLYCAGASLELLSELEHIRWCRFHYLQGWQYGAVRDNDAKLHNCLVPYEELTEEEKQKDRNNVKLAIDQLI